ncbi:MAG: hypothetical protein QXZ02_04525 [Candidatus Bathyarchaeia archaeon]
MRFEVEKITIQNIVASGYLGESIDLKKIKEAFPAAEPLKTGASGVVIQMDKVRIKIFGSGHVNCVGAKSEKAISEAMKKVLETLSAKK